MLDKIVSEILRVEEESTSLIASVEVECAKDEIEAVKHSKIAVEEHQLLLQRDLVSFVDKIEKDNKEKLRNYTLKMRGELHEFLSEFENQIQEVSSDICSSICSVVFDNPKTEGQI